MPADTCTSCGNPAPPAELLNYNGRCENCFAEAADWRAKHDKDRKDNTARWFNVPAGVRLRSCNRMPGVGDGRDWAGNHT